MLRNKKFIIFALILVVILIGVYFYLKSIKQNQIEPINNIALTEEERINILNELSAGSNIKPLSITERQKILKDLNSGASKTPLTEEERTAILNSLNNNQ